jgi:hypothetical protein
MPRHFTLPLHAYAIDASFRYEPASMPPLRRHIAQLPPLIYARPLLSSIFSPFRQVTMR